MLRLGAGRRHPPCSSPGKAESEHQEAKEEAMQQNVPLTWTAAWLLFTTLATAGVLETYSYRSITPFGGAIPGVRATSDAARQLMGPPARVQRTGTAPIAAGERFASGRTTLSRREAAILLVLLQGVRPTLAR
jgi:hypothetical protein